MGTSISRAGSLRLAGVAAGVFTLVIAAAAAAWMLFGFGYSYAAGEGTSAGPGGAGGSVTTVTGWQSAWEYAFAEGEPAVVIWAGVVPALGALSLGAAGSRRPGLGWVAALLLLMLAVLGLASIGLAVLPVALAAVVTAVTVSADRAGRRGAPPSG